MASRPNLAAWLGTLAKSPDYALAFAQTYEALDDSERDAWLDELETENAPEVAYWPLLAVEEQGARSERIGRHIRVPSPDSQPSRGASGMRAYKDGRLLYLLRPMYGAFMGPIRFSFDDTGGLESAVPLPLARETAFEQSLTEGAYALSVDEATLELARGVVACTRSCKEVPALLKLHPELLDARAREGAR